MRTFLILLFVAVAASFVVVGTRRAVDKSNADSRAQSDVVSSQRVARIYAQMADLEAGQVALNRALASASNEIRRLEGRVDEERSALEPLRDKVRVMSAQAITYTSQASEQREAGQRAQKALKESKAELVRVKAELASATEKSEEAVKAAESARETAVAEAQARYAADQEKIALADRLVQEVRVRNKKLQASVEAAHKAMEQQATHVAALEQEVAELKAQLARQSAAKPVAAEPAAQIVEAPAP